MNTNNHHLQAEKLRESEKYKEALAAYKQAIDDYVKRNNFEGLSEALLGIFLTYKHLYLTTNNQLYLVKALVSIQKALEINNTHQLLNAYRVYFSLGEAKVLQLDSTGAVEAYQQAISLMPDDSAEKGNYRYHLGEALYLSGSREEGEKQLFSGLAEIQKYKDSTDSFLYHVWLSGCHLKIATLLWKDNPKVARDHLSKAEDIITHDPKLVIRKRQLEEFKSSLQ